jgi:hypothetical protein
MVDFIGSLNRGLSAAQQAEKNRSEIFSVLDVLNNQLLEAFGGKLRIEIYSKTNPFANFVNLTGSETKPLYSFLAAVNPLAASDKPSELAKWKLDPNGYPCQITTVEDELYCEDKTALERAIQDLLSRPDVGEKISSVMKLKLKPIDNK